MVNDVQEHSSDALSDKATWAVCTLAGMEIKHFSLSLSAKETSGFLLLRLFLVGVIPCTYHLGVTYRAVMKKYTSSQGSVPKIKVGTQINLLSVLLVGPLQA